MVSGDYESMIVVNEGIEYRTSSTGKTRCTIKVSAEPLVCDVDPKRLGKGPAEAIAHHFRQRVLGIQQVASERTLKARKVAAKAFGLNKDWAMKRYAGGKMGPMAPNQTDKLFNDSERMANSITANGSSDGSWRINVAANRLTENAEAIYTKLVELIPEFADSAMLLANDFINAAIQRSMTQMITKAARTSVELPIEIAESLVEMFKTVDETISAAA